VRIWHGERRKLNVMADEIVHVGPDAIQRRRARDLERNKMFRQGEEKELPNHQFVSDLRHAYLRVGFAIHP
jgi:hypothetical protein